MRQPIIAGNWKMNGTRAMAEGICNELVKSGDQLADIGVVICPPAPLLPLVSDILKGTTVHIGVQDVDIHANGAHTGQVSAEMVLDAGGTYAIVGHSERRTNQGESNELVAAKVDVALENGLIPIICLGETQVERENDLTEQVVDRQLQAVITQCGITALQNSLIAYEPVWAIGTGLTATPKQAQQVHRFLRQTMAKLDSAIAAQCRILYGGSMNPKNAAELLAEPDIDGGLIGGASLNSIDFLAICNAAVQQSAA